MARRPACLADAVRPLHRLCQVDAAQHAVPRFLLEILHEGPEGPAGRAVRRQLAAPRAGPEQAHPVLPAPMAVMVVVTVVTMHGRRVVMVGTARRRQETARRRHLERRQPERQRPPSRAATEQTPATAAAAVGVIAVSGPGVRRGAIEEDER